ncbi:hypothetical protein IJG72_04205 [bacterium]|nr:hypothetical protein [bacterium]
MYRCSNCKSIDKFELMFSDDYKGNRNFMQKYNNRKEIEITIDDYTFIPTLDFMNEYAVCKYCGQIYIWEKE